MTAFLEFLRFLWSIAVSLGGLAAAIAVVALLALTVLPAQLRRLAIRVAIGAGLAAAGYVVGRHDERSFYKARLAREIAKAVLKGEEARSRALQEFDNDDDAADDGFRRD